MFAGILLYECDSKDGRWLGGITPTGYSAERSKYGSGKKKNAFTYLVTVPEEKALVEYIFSTFLYFAVVVLESEELKEKNTTGIVIPEECGRAEKYEIIHFV